MSAKTTRKNSSAFSKEAKDGLAIGEELNSGGIVWRKLKDGTGVWRYDFSLNGRRYKGVLGRERDNVTLSSARAQFQTIRAEKLLEATSSKTNSRGLTEQLFSVASKEYLTWSDAHHRDKRHHHGRMQKHLTPRFGTKKLSEITVSDIEQLRTELLNEGLARSTVKKIICLMSSVFEHTKKSDPEIINPTRNISKLKEAPQKIKVFSQEDTNKLLETSATSKRDKVMVGLALYAGLRASEVLGLHWNDINFEKNMIRVCRRAVEGNLEDTTKSGKERYVHITPKLHKILIDHRREDKSKNLVLTPDGESPYHHIQHIFNKLKLRSAVTEKAGFHALRHTFATRAVEKGVALPVLQKWMGHSDIKTTMGYIHMSNEYSKEMAKLLD